MKRFLMQISVFFFIVLSLYDCCTPTNKTLNNNIYKSRDYHLVNPDKMKDYEFHSPDLFLVSDSLQMDTMIKAHYFDTFAQIKKDFRKINFRKSSLLVGNIQYTGDFKGSNLYVNHENKKIALDIAYFADCGIVAVYQHSKFIAYLFPKVTREYELEK
jgi:hypothetical protein